MNTQNFSKKIKLLLIFSPILLFAIWMGFWLGKSSQPQMAQTHSTNQTSPNKPSNTETAAMPPETPAVRLPISKWRADQMQLWRVGNALSNTDAPWQGQIALNEEKLAHIFPAFAAQVRETNAHLGDYVEKNAVLATLRSPEWVNLQSDIQRAESSLHAAQTVVDREKMLFDAKVSAKQDLLAAQAARDQAKISLNTAQARAQSLQSQTGKSGDYLVRAPIAGEIIEKHAIMGETVTSETKLFVLADTHSVWAEFQIPVDQAGNIQVGQAIEIMDSQNKSHAAQIAHISRVGNADTRQIEAHAVLDNPTNQWQIGQFIQVRLVKNTVLPENQFEIPSHAVQNWDGQNYVFIQKNAEYLPIKIEMATSNAPDRTLVLSGVQVGDDIVTEGSFLLKAELLKPSEEE